MAERDPNQYLDWVSAAIFASGCMAMCAWMIWLGPDGFVPGFAAYVMGSLLAREVEGPRLGQ